MREKFIKFRANGEPSMKQHLKALLVILVIALVGAWAFNTFYLSKLQEAPSSFATLEAMEKEGAPNFTAKDLNGASFDLRSLKGKVVVLNFWASWCAPCVEEVPSLIKLIKEFKGNVQLIAVSGDSSLEDIHVFLKSFPELQAANIKVVWDEDRSLMKQFQVSRLPESLVLDKDQKLAKKLVGSIDWYTNDSKAYIQTLLAK